jgi:hypothetical protein
LGGNAPLKKKDGWGFNMSAADDAQAPAAAADGGEETLSYTEASYKVGYVWGGALFIF